MASIYNSANLNKNSWKYDEQLNSLTLHTIEEVVSNSRQSDVTCYPFKLIYVTCIQVNIHVKVFPCYIDLIELIRMCIPEMRSAAQSFFLYWLHSLQYNCNALSTTNASRANINITISSLEFISKMCSDSTPRCAQRVA